MPKVTNDAYIHQQVQEASTASLNNKLGITDRSKLDQVEHMFSYLRMLELNEKQLEKQDNLIAGLQAVNHYLLQDVYEWAGELRQGNHDTYLKLKTDKDYHYDNHYRNFQVPGDSKKFLSDFQDAKLNYFEGFDPIWLDAAVFSIPFKIEEIVTLQPFANYEEDLVSDKILSEEFGYEPDSIPKKNLLQEFEQDNHLKNLDIDKFCEKAGYYLYNLKDTHHFYKGNKETQYTFINQLAHNNNYHIAWENISALQLKHTYRENLLLPGQPVAEANIASHLPLCKLIRENIIDKSYSYAVQKYIEKSGTEVQQAETGKTYYGNVLGVTERFVVQKMKDNPACAIIHDRKTLTKDIAPSDQCIKISYPHGKIGLVSELHEKDKAIDKNLRKELDTYYTR